MAGKSVLLLRVSLDGVDHQFELAEGKKFIIGRSPSAQLKLSAPNISTEHLEVYVAEGQVRVRDLNSANGTFRNPAKAPFVEAFFPLSFESLELLLAKTPVKLSWESLAPQQSTQVEKTIPLAEVKTKLLEVPSSAAEVAVPVKATPKVSKVKKTKKKNTSAAKVEAAAPAPKLSAPVMAALAFLPFAMALAGAVGCLLWLRSEYLAGLDHSDQSLWGQGVAWDIFVGWFLALEQKGWIFLLLIFALYFLGLRILNLKGWTSPVSGRRPLAGLPLTLAVSLLVILFPWLQLVPYGVKPQQWGALLERVQKLEDPKLGLKDKHAQLSNLLPTYKGSSYFYARRFQVQTRRVVEECDGAGEKAWENKKVCLLLLHAVGIENLEDFSPVFLKDIAVRNSLILSLDGIIRVVGAEGKESKTLNYFLNSLSLVGLESERAKIYGILFERNLEIPEIQGILQELRQSLEDRIQEQYGELRVPAFLRFSVRSPIEVGI